MGSTEGFRTGVQEVSNQDVQRIAESEGLDSVEGLASSRVINKELDVMEGLAASKTGEEPTRSISGK
jgi:hypothetical protein